MNSASQLPRALLQIKIMLGKRMLQSWPSSPWHGRVSGTHPVSWGVLSSIPAECQRCTCWLHGEQRQQFVKSCSAPEVTEQKHYLTCNLSLASRWTDHLNCSTLEFPSGASAHQPEQLKVGCVCSFGEGSAVMWDQSSKLCSMQGPPSPHPQNPSQVIGPT